MPWGQKQAFKYVVDGGLSLHPKKNNGECSRLMDSTEWKVREDEAKEWGELHRRLGGRE